MTQSARIDFATLERPAKPNTFLMAPEGLCRKAKTDAVPPIFTVAAAKLRQEFLNVAIARPRVSHTLSDERALYDDFVVRSALLRFPDLVSVKFLDLNDGRSTLALYARAVYGYSDMGVNRARSLDWLARVGRAVPAAGA
jgi:uncharacterized protein (DUF1499 family)